MLKGIDPLINPDLLAVLARMGHGDEIVIADANFPSASVAAHTTMKRELHLNCDAVRAMRALLTLLPLDEHEPNPVLSMQVVDHPDAIPAPVAEASRVLAPQSVAPHGLERFAFYARAKTAFAIIRTAETRHYGNFILRKGVIDELSSAEEQGRS